MSEKKIEIKFAGKTLFEIPTDALDKEDSDLVAQNFKRAQELLDQGKPAQAAVFAGSALLMPTILSELKEKE